MVLRGATQLQGHWQRRNDGYAIAGEDGGKPVCSWKRHANRPSQSAITNSFGIDLHKTNRTESDPCRIEESFPRQSQRDGLGEHGIERVSLSRDAKLWQNYTRGIYD